MQVTFTGFIITALTQGGRSCGTSPRPPGRRARSRPPRPRRSSGSTRYGSRPPGLPARGRRADQARILAGQVLHEVPVAVLPVIQATNDVLGLPAQPVAVEKEHARLVRGPEDGGVPERNREDLRHVPKHDLVALEVHAPS